MTYIILSEQQTIVGEPFESYDQAFIEASQIFGEDPMEWVSRNVRVEENR